MTPADPANAALPPARTRTLRRMAMLERLAEVGMEIAEALGRDACSPAPVTADHPHNAGLVFARVARAVRMTIALELRLERDLVDLGNPAPPVARPGVRIAPPCAVGQAADDDGDANPTERLSYEGYERLIDDEDGDLMRLPFDEAVAAIRQDLGLSAPKSFPRALRVGEAPANAAGLSCERDGHPSRGSEWGLKALPPDEELQRPLRPRSLSSGRPSAEPGGAHLPQPCGPGEEVEAPAPPLLRSG